MAKAVKELHSSVAKLGKVGQKSADTSSNGGEFTGRVASEFAHVSELAPAYVGPFGCSGGFGSPAKGGGERLVTMPGWDSACPYWEKENGGLGMLRSQTQRNKAKLTKQP